MAISLATTPTYPLPSKAPTRVAFSGVVSGNWGRIWCTNAPDGSTLRKRLDDHLDQAGAARVEVFVGDVTTFWGAPLDVGGAYTFLVQEYTKGAQSYGGGHYRSTAGYPSETKVGGESTVTIYVGERMRSRHGAAPRGTAELVFYMFGSQIRATTIKEHGEETPRWENLSGPLAFAATEAVNGGELSITSASASTVLGDLETFAETLVAKFNAHRTQATVHANNDSANVINTEFGTQVSGVAGLVNVVNEARRLFIRHITNDSGTGAASASYHEQGGSGIADWARHPIAPPAADMESAVILLADLVRCYSAHLGWAAPGHTNADLTNGIGSVSNWIGRHVQFLGTIASLSPTAPATSNPGTTLASALIGARIG